jgi:hypothetical protein
MLLLSAVTSNPDLYLLLMQTSTGSSFTHMSWQRVVYPDLYGAFKTTGNFEKYEVES